jgi:hypothetical protein
MPNQRNGSGERPNFLNRLGTSFRNFANRQVQGTRNASPTSGHPRWYLQALDMLSEPIIGGNLFDSQSGERGSFQFPGQSTVRSVGNGLRGLFGDRQPGANEWGPPGNLAGPDPNAWGPPSSLGPVDPNAWGPPEAQSNNPRQDPNAYGPPRDLMNRTPGEGARNSLMASNAALRHAEEMRVLMAMFGTGLPRGER